MVTAIRIAVDPSRSSPTSRSSWLGVMVNEMTSDRERRRGQLVLGGRPASSSTCVATAFPPIAPSRSLSPMTDSVLAQVHVVLFEPQNQINIAAVIRAMKNMGVRSLRLVRPVEYDPYRLEGIAHDTNDIIERIQTLRRTSTRRLRTASMSRPTRRGGVPRNGSSRIRAGRPREILAATRHGPAAILFGREDKGLPNEALDRARNVVNIPTTDHASLNLAQAVLVALYELHLAAGDATRVIGPPRDEAPPATSEQYERLFDNAARRSRSSRSSRLAFPSTSCVVFGRWRFAQTRTRVRSS